MEFDDSGYHLKCNMMDHPNIKPIIQQFEDETSSLRIVKCDACRFAFPREIFHSSKKSVYLPINAEQKYAFMPDDERFYILNVFKDNQPDKTIYKSKDRSWFQIGTCHDNCKKYHQKFGSFIFGNQRDL